MSISILFVQNALSVLQLPASVVILVDPVSPELGCWPGEWLLECGYLWRREPEKAYPPPAVPSDAAPLGLSRDTLPPPRVG